MGVSEKVIGGGGTALHSPGAFPHSPGAPPLKSPWRGFRGRATGECAPGECRAATPEDLL